MTSALRGIFMHAPDLNTKRTVARNKDKKETVPKNYLSSYTQTKKRKTSFYSVENRQVIRVAFIVQNFIFKEQSNKLTENT